MKLITIAAIALAASSTLSATAAARGRHPRHHYAHRAAEPCGNSGRWCAVSAGQSRSRGRGHRTPRLAYDRGRGLCRERSAAGPVVLNCVLAPRMLGFIRDVVARGFRGPVHCYARGGHVRRSLHYTGRACDFAQTGWNRTVRVMYHVEDLTRKWGLRNGCDFRHPRRDCGHVDAGPIRSARR